MTKSRWIDLCQTLKINPDLQEYTRLIEAYKEPHRAYHTQQHLSECLNKLDWVMVRTPPQDKALLEIALWYHDAVYDTSAQDNELKSTEWAVGFLRDAGLAPALCECVRELIMATCHDDVPTDPLQQLIVDIDLSILATDESRFAEYEIQVRQEYSWVPLAVYKDKRREVLQQFLDFPQVYQTQRFYDVYEEAARDNLMRAIAL